MSSRSVYMQCLHHRIDWGREGISWKGEIHLLGSVSIGKQLAVWLPHLEHGQGNIYWRFFFLHSHTALNYLSSTRVFFQLNYQTVFQPAVYLESNPKRMGLLFLSHLNTKIEKNTSAAMLLSGKYIYSFCILQSTVLFNFAFQLCVALQRISEIQRSWNSESGQGKISVHKFNHLRAVPRLQTEPEGWNSQCSPTARTWKRPLY